MIPWGYPNLNAIVNVMVKVEQMLSAIVLPGIAPLLCWGSDVIMYLRSCNSQIKYNWIIKSVLCIVWVNKLIKEKFSSLQVTFNQWFLSCSVSLWWNIQCILLICYIRIANTNDLIIYIHFNDVIPIQTSWCDWLYY